MELLTLDILKRMTPGLIFARGVALNGIIPTKARSVNELPHIGYELSLTYDKVDEYRIIWMAKRGRIHDWTIYAGTEADFDYEKVERVGRKLTMEQNIKILVPCDEEAWNMYRH